MCDKNGWIHRVFEAWHFYSRLYIDRPQARAVTAPPRRILASSSINATCPADQGDAPSISAVSSSTNALSDSTSLASAATTGHVLNDDCSSALHTFKQSVTFGSPTATQNNTVFLKQNVTPADGTEDVMTAPNISVHASAYPDGSRYNIGLLNHYYCHFPPSLS